MKIKGKELLDRTILLKHVNLATPFVQVTDLIEQKDPPFYMKVTLCELADPPTMPGADSVVNLETGRVLLMKGDSAVQLVDANLVVDN